MKYVGLFAGPNVRESRIVAAVTDPRIVVSVARAALRNLAQPPDPVLAHLAAGNRSALEEVIRGAETDSRRGKR